jgi:tRNA(adenine34) deaminase
MNLEIDERNMQLALAEARQALEAEEFPVGCIMTCGEEIVARGKRSNSRGEAANEMDHAEISALRNLLDNRPDIDPSKVTVYATMEPCLMCYVTMLLNGIRRFVYAYEDAMGGGTGLDLKSQKPLFREMAVEVIPHLCRDESLALLEKYTLDQP